MIQRVKKHIKKHRTYRYTYKEVEFVELIYEIDHTIIPYFPQKYLLNWYHLISVHPGQRRMIETICSIFTWKGMQQQVNDTCHHCYDCQISKTNNKRNMV